MKKYQISIAICTYRRPEMLREAIETLICQETDGKVNWEILVIDNDHNCSAKDIVEQATSTKPISIRYILERNAGLSHARNRAVIEAEGEIIAFLDDDTLVPRRWLMEMLNTFRRTGADCVGGRVLVKWDGIPDIGLKQCEKEIVNFDRGDHDFRIVGRKISPIGANIAFRDSLFKNGMKFTIGLGRTKSNLMGGEETDLLLRLQSQQKRIWYGANCVVFHRTGGERLTEKYYIKREYWNGISLSDIDRSQKSILFCFLKAWIRVSQVCFLLLPCWLFNKGIRNKRYEFLNACYISKYFGYWRSIMGMVRKND